MLFRSLVPGQATDLTLAMGYGIVSLYALFAVVATSWPKLKFGRRVWRAIHLVGIPAAILAAMHAYQSGSDRDALAFQAMIVVLFGLIVYPAVLRVLAVRRRRAEKRHRLSRRTLTDE